MHAMLWTLWLAVHHRWRSVGGAGRVGCLLGVLFGLVVLLTGCNQGGNQGHLTPQPGANPTLERQAVDNLLDLYRTALRQADIDRVDALTDDQGLLATLSTTFRTRTVTALDIP